MREESYYVYIDRNTGEWGAVKEELYNRYPDMIPVSHPPGLIGPYWARTKVDAFRQAAEEAGRGREMSEYEKERVSSIRKALVTEENGW